MTGFGLLRPPPRIIFGEGAAVSAGAVAAEWGRRILVCTDPQIASTPALARVRASLKAEDLEAAVFSDCAADLPIATLDSGLAYASHQRPDAIVAVGGGSVIDCAKLLALLLRHPGPVSEYYGENRVPGRVVPVIAIPTTAGTGSEVTPVAVLTDPARTLKVGVSSPYLTPVCAICDPDLLASCPATVAAHSGIDALAHAIESYTAIDHAADDWVGMATTRVFVGANELSDVMALAAVERIGAGLVAMVRKNDAGSRHLMAAGSLLAGLAFATAGTAAAHALQYPIGARTATTHGIGVGVLLPYVMTFNLPAREPRFVEIAKRLGVSASAAAAVDAVESLCSQIGIPHTLAQLGVAEGDLPEIALDAFGVTRLAQNNPLPLDVEALRRILDAAWTGDRLSLRGNEVDM